MATTLSIGVPANITTGSADVLSEVIFPENARSYSLQPRANAAKIVESGGADAGAIGVIPYRAHPAGTSASYPAPGTRGVARCLVSTDRKVWITSATGSTVIEVIAYTAPYEAAG